MPYLFISFSDNLERDSRNKKDFYNLSLEKQYQLIQKRIPTDKKIDSFREFIEKCFPSGMKKRYYLSCPNFLRKKRENDNGTSYLNNLVIRPEKTLSMKSILPENQNIILIGDIYEGGKLKMFAVKGIQLIDDSMSSPYDIVISNSPACNSFSRNTWSINHVDYNDTYFTPNNILEIIEHCYTVENPAEVIKTYREWQTYFKFRDYYLKEQTKRNFKLDSCEYLETYAVNRKEYRMDSMIYDECILDGLDDFKRGDMIVLNKKVSAAESFPLIRLDIIRNKKLFLTNVVTKGKKQVNEEERQIRSLASDNVIITELDPKKEDNKLGILINSGYELGERFKTIKFEIEPTEHIEKLIEQYKATIKDSIHAIELKYENLVQKETKVYINEVRNLKEQELDDEAFEYAVDLNNKLDLEVERNQDKDILKLINVEIDRIKKSNKKSKDESKDEFEARINALISNIDIRHYYVLRNENLINSFRLERQKKVNNELQTLETEKQRELTNKYKEDISNKSKETKDKYEAELEIRKAEIIENETEICFSIYFKPNERREVNNKMKEQIKSCEYIVYDHRAESAKLNRQKNALENFYSGNVKNPYLSTYLFTPNKLQQIVPNRVDWTWYLDSLNEKQKEAVRKAVSSNGVFLLQGPPGTGKTQVIAETVAHLVKDGKKVLISSETHKAIDNVFERLPKIAEIVPIRLIPSKNNKESDYTPKYLVDNFYLNISTNMKNIVSKYKNFKKNKEDFEEHFGQLKLLNSKIEKTQVSYNLAQQKIDALDKQAKQKNMQISELKEQIDSIRMTLDTLRRTRRHADRYNLSLDEDIRQDFIAKFIDSLTANFDSNIFVTTDIEALIKLIINTKRIDIEAELLTVNPESSSQILNAKIKELKRKMDAIDDKLDGEIDDNSEYQTLRKEWMSLKKQEKESGIKGTTEGILNKIFIYDFMIKNLDSVIAIIEGKKDSLVLLRNDIISEIDNEINHQEEKQDTLQAKINSIGKEIKNINNQINEIEDSNEVQDIQSNRVKLETQIDQFFREFEILEPYKDVNDALNIIKNTFDDLEQNYAKREAENKEKIPMYEKISKFLSQADVIEDDRRLYTKELFESANVFGITCTSNDRFSSENNSELGDFNIDDIDIKTVGIDVVIIDEVSKSSFIDLLIPILYGKTVILVGDHRQLPPMYEFAKMRDDEFESLDENIINKDINKKFTQMYEECFFKTLFEKIPNDYKTMLVQQYRCHEHIMKVFNHFYQGELRIGFNGQNNQKKHNIELYSNGRKIIQQDKHIYFVDCREFETRDQDSTSIYNIGEAKVVVEMLKKLKLYFRNNPRVESLSVGVICTYGDQAKKIKDLMKAEKITSNDFKNGQEKLIVSTVDDFQGDERDIIILSTVRNPQEPGKSNPGFILAYQRINVALSRARRLLVVVGNRNYLEQRGVIDLPDVYGREESNQRNFRVYEEILNTIEMYGKVLDDIDIIESKEGKINA